MTVGVLVMAYGTPASRDDIPAYYTDIRRGRPPSDDEVADLTRRYDAIGGTFPLRAITEAQAALLAQHLGDGYAVELGLKHAAPKVEDGVRALESLGVDGIVGLVLAPHYSSLSVGEYAGRAAKAATVPVETVESWHLLPEYLDFLAAAVTDALATVPAESEVVFTAHSLPARIVAAEDPYPDQVRATADAVAALAGLKRWSVGWQSAGRTPEPWLGPEVNDLIRERAEEGAAGLVVCACGFVADHLEVAYDLDVAAREIATQAGLPFARTRSLNDDGTVFAALAALVREHAGR